MTIDPSSMDLDSKIVLRGAAAHRSQKVWEWPPPSPSDPSVRVQEEKPLAAPAHSHLFSILQGTCDMASCTTLRADGCFPSAVMAGAVANVQIAYGSMQRIRLRALEL